MGCGKVERLQKVMARAGVASRRQCEQLILQGIVTVNGQVVKELGMKINPDQDVIKVSGKKLSMERKKTFLFYKPLGVITSMTDPQERKVVADFFRHVVERVYPVGRLDYDTEGLLLMTNDGELANRLMHPRYKVQKHYIAQVKGIPSATALKRLQSGIKLEEGWTAPAKVKLVKVENGIAHLALQIHEGRNRQIRRMCEAVGHAVVRLKRVQMGFLTLDGLRPGASRECTTQELKKLHQMLNL